MKTFLKALGIVGLTFSIGAGGVWAQSGFSTGGMAAMLTKLDSIITALGNPATDCGTLSSCPNLGGVYPLAAPKGGATPVVIEMSGASTNSANIKSGAGTLYSFQIEQTNTTAGNLRFYDVSGAPTCSSATNLVKEFWIPSNASSVGRTVQFRVGVALANGLGYCFTGAKGKTDNTSWGGTTGDVILNVDYK